MVRLRVKEIAKQKGISMGKLSRASDISYVLMADFVKLLHMRINRGRLLSFDGKSRVNKAPPKWCLKRLSLQWT